MELDKLRVINEVMTPLPQTVDKGDLLGLAQSLMETHHIRHLPVLDGETLFGLISDRDIKLARFVGEKFVPGQELVVGDVCNREPYTVAPGTELDEVTLHMAEKRIGSALVVEDNKVIGVFTATDALRWVGTYIRSQKVAEGN